MNCCKVFKFTDGNTCISVVGLKHEGGGDVFYHNCSTGSDVIQGLAVFNESCDIVGMNLEYSTSWTMVYV